MLDRFARFCGLHVWAPVAVLLVVVVVGAPLVDAVSSVLGAFEGVR